MERSFDSEAARPPIRPRVYISHPPMSLSSQPGSETVPTRIDRRYAEQRHGQATITRCSDLGRSQVALTRTVVTTVPLVVGIEDLPYRHRKVVAELVVAGGEAFGGLVVGHHHSFPLNQPSTHMRWRASRISCV